MKSWMFLLSFLMTHLLACPDLAGFYHCQSSEDSFDVTIEQFVDSKGFHVYDFMTHDETVRLVVDGSSIDQEIDKMKYTITPSCPDGESSFVLNLRFKGTSQGVPVTGTSVTTTVPTEDGLLNTLKTKVIVYGQTFETEEKETCVRSNS